MRASQRGQRRSRRAALRILGDQPVGLARRRAIDEHLSQQSFETVVGGHVVRSRTGPMDASCSVLMLRAQSREAAVQSGLGGPVRDVKDVGRLSEGQADIEMQHDDGALIDGQASQQPLETVAFREHHRRVRHTRRLPVGRHVQLDQVSSTLTPGRLVTGTDRESTEPGFPRVGVAQRAHALPGGYERFLHRVLGAVPVTKDEGGDGVLA